MHEIEFVSEFVTLERKYTMQHQFNADLINIWLIVIWLVFASMISIEFKLESWWNEQGYLMLRVQQSDECRAANKDDTSESKKPHLQKSCRGIPMDKVKAHQASMYNFHRIAGFPRRIPRVNYPLRQIR